MRGCSLRLRLALGLTVGVLVIWGVAMLAAGISLGEELGELSGGIAAQTAERMLPVALASWRAAGAPQGGAPLRAAAVAQDEDHLRWALRAASGEVLMLSADADAARFAALPLGPAEMQAGGWHVATHRAAQGGFVLQAAETRAGRFEAIRETLRAMALPLLVLVPGSLALVLWLTQRALAPLGTLVAEVAGRDAGDLRALGGPPLPPELAPIRAAVDALLARLRRALEAERSFSANAAHEMRTPVAAMLAQVQRLVAEAPQGPLRARAGAIEAELRRLAALTARLLDLARAEGGGARLAAPVDLVPALRLVLQDCAAAPPRWSLALPERLAARLDPDAFAILARNLLENALLHGAPGGPIAVRLTPAGRFSVTSAGPPVPPERLARLATRFERAGARGPGTGLGLAIARAVAEGAGLELRLSSPPEGAAEGFEAALDLGPLLG